MQWTVGQKGRGGVAAVAVKKSTTTPPQPYTEGSLLAAMEGAARFIADPRLREALREAKGLGTPATRASIIETLKKRGWLEEKKKTLRSTADARRIIAMLPKMLTDPGTTALWEMALDAVAKGEMTLEQFTQRQEAATRQLVAEALAKKHD